MSAISSSLEIQVHSVDGPVTRFVQDDTETIRRLLDRMEPRRIFAQHHLLITDEHSITIFPCSAIARVDLVMDRCPDWPFQPGVSDIVEITEREFARRYRGVQYQLRPPNTAGRTVAAFGEIELANADRVYLEAQTVAEPRLQLDRSLLLHHLLSAPSLYSRRRGGGAIILNPAHIVRWSFYPGAPEVTPHASMAAPAFRLGGNDPRGAMYTEKVAPILPRPGPFTVTEGPVASRADPPADRAKPRRTAERRRERIAGSVLTPVRWVVILGIVASLNVRFGLEMDRTALLAALALYTAAAAGLPRLRGRLLTPATVERLLLAADLLFSVVTFHFSGGMRSPYFGLCYLAMIHTALVLRPSRSLVVATGLMGVVLLDEFVFPPVYPSLLVFSVVLSKLCFLPLIAWAGGRLAQELREREVARRQAERRTSKLEANEERVRREMEIARQVQEKLLPVTMPPFRGLTLAVLSRPAHQVGGDIYDLIELPDGRLLIAVADVSGKGVPAALLTVAVQQAIRQFAGPDPAAVLAGVNRLLLENTPDEMFVTAVCVLIDPREGTAAVASAGHPPLLWWDRGEGRLTPVTAPGMVLGLMPEWSGRTVRWPMAEGDALLLYTDGAADAKLGHEERLGEERLAELLGRTQPRDAEEWIARLREALDGCVAWPDDVTAVAVVRTLPGG